MQEQTTKPKYSQNVAFENICEHCGFHISAHTEKRLYCPEEVVLEETELAKYEAKILPKINTDSLQQLIGITDSKLKSFINEKPIGWARGVYVGIKIGELTIKLQAYKKALKLVHDDNQ